ncbi:hypothetical protein [Methanolobus profundi]|uniref:DNA replication factor GINS n=1 Tax=Methanolobus profundi TaxID=487685 RepID=A0A1I4UBC3_9EURY|nr:hypothetical protein [Methanolobus profundi]SFM86299.1 DNA replication factor GINS [Methanolobus profundi]
MDRTELKNSLREESSSTLRALHPGFFPDVEEYVKELEEEIQNINSPRSVESKMLEDELQSAITDIEVIFLRRIKKIISYATNNAFSSMPPSQDMSKLLPQEKEVYDAVLSAINSARKELLVPILDPQATRDKVRKPPAINKEEERPARDMEAEQQEMPSDSEDDSGDKAEIGKSNINKEFVVVRILEDLPTFKAMDNRNYTLYAEDVVVLPTLNAKGLIKRNVAQMIL